MKILSYRVGVTTFWGAAVGDGVIDLASLTGFPTVRSALERGDMSQIAQLLAGAQPTHALDAVVLLPVVPDPGKILCVGTNYHDHRIETGREVPDSPVIFARFASSQAGPVRPVRL